MLALRTNESTWHHPSLNPLRCSDFNSLRLNPFHSSIKRSYLNPNEYFQKIYGHIKCNEIQSHIYYWWDYRITRLVILLHSFTNVVPKRVLYMIFATRPPASHAVIPTQMARFMGPTWGPSGYDRTQVGPMLAPWTLLSGDIQHGKTIYHLRRTAKVM